MVMFVTSLWPIVILSCDWYLKQTKNSALYFKISISFYFRVFSDLWRYLDKQTLTCFGTYIEIASAPYRYIIINESLTWKMACLKV